MIEKLTIPGNWEGDIGKLPPSCSWIVSFSTFSFDFPGDISHIYLRHIHSVGTININAQVCTTQCKLTQFNATADIQHNSHTLIFDIFDIFILSLIFFSLSFDFFLFISSLLKRLNLVWSRRFWRWRWVDHYLKRKQCFHYLSKLQNVFVQIAFHSCYNPLHIVKS